MFIRNRHNSPARRGSILVIVLAMLALFAVVGLSFVLYSESEATSMRNASGAVNQASDPDTQEVSNDFLRQLIFGTPDNTSSVFGNDLATADYGWNGVGQNLSPHAGSGIPQEDVGNSAAPTWTPASIPSLDRRQVVNYTRDSNGFYVRPNVRVDGTTPINKSTGYTYADRANFYLAMQNPTTGEIVQPSFLRPDLFGPLDPTNGGAASNNWTNDVGRYFTVRPRPRENPNFPLVPANADGTYTGDVQNLKLIAGPTQKNDSIWMYAGGPVKTWRNKKYAACIAPLVLELSGRVNMSVAGNNRNAGAAHASNQGFGAWEVNPVALGATAGDQTQLASDLQTILSQRYGQTPTYSPNAPPNRYTGLQVGTINGGSVPPQYALIDSDGVGSGAADPMSLPSAGTYNPFLVFTPRFAGNQLNFNTELTNHPQTFNPFHWPRGKQTGAHAQGMDDVVKLAARYIDPKTRYTQTELGAFVSFGAGTAAAQQNRALTTGFNVTQSWAEVQIRTATGSAKLGPVDLNRKLADYRDNTALPYHPDNMSNPSAARASRQLLAMDIFLRLAALVPGLVDGTNIFYNPLTHSLNNLDTAANPAIPAASIAALRRLAQYAANIVDAIDADDISTSFVWNAVTPLAGIDPNTDANNFSAAQLGNRVVYGTELPRLVVNEAYGELVNDRQDPVTMMGKQQATRNFQKKFWVELHNPLMPDSARPELGSGAARLQWQQNISPDKTNTGTYTGTTFAAYRLDILEAANLQSNAFSAGLTDVNVTGNPGGVNGTPIANLTRKIELNQFIDDRTAAPPATPPAAVLMGDAFNQVLPVAPRTTASGTPGRNEGYYVVGPKDDFPGGLVTTLRTADPPAPPATPVAAMSYDAGLPSGVNLMAQAQTTNTVVLRRLANPYLQPNDPNNLVAPFAYDNTKPANPYITVDFLEALPVRNRVDYDDTLRAAALVDATKNFPSIGRKHPYACAPSYGAANSIVIDQVAAGVTPAHTFFKANTNYNNAAFIHFDRELINSSELLHISVQPPYLLTASFFDGTVFQRHNGSSATAMSALMPNSTFPTGVANPASQLFKAFDLLTTANRLPGIPLGGREPGKINMNTVGDPRLLQALFDPQQGNRFTTTYPNLVSDVWTKLLQGTADPLSPTRTPNWGTAPYLRATRDEGAATGDWPFKLMGSSNSYEDTLFRSMAPPPVAYPFPRLFNPYAPAPTNPYSDDEEPHRKAWNNLTTVSDGFLVIWTVGFFEIDESVTPYVVGNVPILGKELFDKVPGDLRAQYAAVVDRSTIQVPLAPAARTNGAKPWETKLMADATVGSTSITVEGFVPAAGALQIYNGGPLPVDVTVNSQIRVGYGDSGAAVSGDGEWLTITGITSVVGSGTATLTFAAPGIQRFHGASTRVSNALPGNPGPQPSFDPSNALNRHIVPYFTKLDP